MKKDQKFELKTSRALSSFGVVAFRIEKEKVYGEDYFDVIWQANGEEEQIAMLVNERDLKDLRSLIDTVLEEVTNVEFSEPQESNKEEEPSKKPSMTIGCNECGNNIKI